jgi:multidrug resistance efflux pump
MPDTKLPADLLSRDDPFTARIAALEAQVEDLKGSVGYAQACYQQALAQVAALQARLAQADDRLQSLRQGVQNALDHDLEVH